MPALNAPPLFPTVCPAVTERLQLGPADACLLSVVYPDDEAEVDTAAKSALQLAGIWYFPMDLIKDLEVWKCGDWVGCSPCSCRNGEQRKGVTSNQRRVTLQPYIGKGLQM